MKVLIACEYSGAVRDAFAKRGHDAMSCDLLETDAPGKHYKGDVRDVLGNHWDMIIAHPECTRLTNAGVRWLHERNLWADLDEACDFFNLFLDHECEKIVIENPVPHKYAIERLRRNYDQTIQPYHHGHMESKRTCLWLKGVPLLQKTNDVEIAMRQLPYGERNKIHYASPGPDRWKIRSKTYSGIADALAEQYG